MASTRYHLIKKIGSGCTATIWTAFDQTLQTVVAIKIVKGDTKIIQHEVDNIQKIQEYTACIPTIHDWGHLDQLGEFTDITYLTMPLYEPLPVKIHIGIVFEIIVAIMRLHTVHLYHGDLHPKNIMLQRVDYPRRYNVNNIEYTITHPEMPVIIDWAHDLTCIRNDLGLLAAPESTFGYERALKDILRMCDHSRECVEAYIQIYGHTSDLEACQLRTMPSYNEQMRQFAIYFMILQE